MKIENFIGKEPFIQKDEFIEKENWIKNEKQIEIRDQIRNEDMLKMIYNNRLIVFLFKDQEIWKGERSVTGGEGCGWGEGVHMVWKGGGCINCMMEKSPASALTSASECWKNR